MACTLVVVGLGAITTGTILLMWMGEQITERGIGNGASLIIFSGIIAQLPSKLAQMMKDKSISPFDIVILVSLFLILIALTILLSQGVRKIPLQYGKKMQGRRLVQARSQSIQFNRTPRNAM